MGNKMGPALVAWISVAKKDDNFPFLSQGGGRAHGP